MTKAICYERSFAISWNTEIVILHFCLAELSQPLSPSHSPCVPSQSPAQAGRLTVLPPCQLCPFARRALAPKDQGDCTLTKDCGAREAGWRVHTQGLPFPSAASSLPFKGVFYDKRQPALLSSPHLGHLPSTSLPLMVNLATCCV